MTTGGFYTYCIEAGLSVTDAQTHARVTELMVILPLCQSSLDGTLRFYLSEKKSGNVHVWQLWQVFPYLHFLMEKVQKLNGGGALTTMLRHVSPRDGSPQARLVVSLGSLAVKTGFGFKTSFLNVCYEGYSHINC